MLSIVAMYVLFSFVHAPTQMFSVMRLTRPTFATPLVVTSDPASRDLPKDTLNAQLRSDSNSLQGMEELCIGQTLVLPQSFGYALTHVRQKSENWRD